ncbi:hypothetical protein NA57DRAFT_71651 [Rhizodiscina lignyota]|uniref:Tat pathway signal sequence n=1 Tax=Rhizodiscina lignyota TaxID=1504668 RepID=A0A9P4IQG7_9PEZI|nr:hypothetical protein NA57DRAFT_71651 [Rhizodiscina lignyota]
MAKNYSDVLFNSSEDEKPLLEEEQVIKRYTSRATSWNCLLAAACGYMLGVGSSLLFKERFICTDPSLALWSPANGAVKWKTVTSDRYFFTRSPYMGTDIERLDAMWADLYDYGTSAISPAENSKLLNSTLPSPKDNNTYVVELQVFHDLHCLNMIRKTAYPDQYPEMWEYYENGTVNHNSLPSFHLDHCIDSLRQGLMCTADVTPVVFHHNADDPYHIFPQIWSTRTCRDFDRIKEWAIDRQIERWKLDLDVNTKIVPAEDLSETFG